MKIQWFLILSLVFVVKSIPTSNGDILRDDAIKNFQYLSYLIAPSVNQNTANQNASEELLNGGTMTDEEIEMALTELMSKTSQDFDDFLDDLEENAEDQRKVAQNLMKLTKSLYRSLMVAMTKFYEES